MLSVVGVSVFVFVFVDGLERNRTATAETDVTFSFECGEVQGPHFHPYRCLLVPTLQMAVDEDGVVR